MLNFILTGIVLAVPSYMAFEVIHGYTTATGTTFERLKAAFRSSLTIFWARVNSLSVGGIWLLGQAADLAGAPGVKEAVAPWLTPELLLGYGAFVVVGSEVARRIGQWRDA